MGGRNILWFDDLKAENDIKKFFPNHCDQVDCVNTFKDFFERISTSKIKDYDLIVLDVNLTDSNFAVKNCECILKIQ